LQIAAVIVLPIASAVIARDIGARDLGKRLTVHFFFVPQMPNILKIRL
jgi:hypothetical protein